jgi:hypothetical protein
MTAADVISRILPLLYQRRPSSPLMRRGINPLAAAAGAAQCPSLGLGV